MREVIDEMRVFEAQIHMHILCTCRPAGDWAGFAITMQRYSASTVSADVLLKIGFKLVSKLAQRA